LASVFTNEYRFNPRALPDINKACEVVAPPVFGTQAFPVSCAGNLVRSGRKEPNPSAASAEVWLVHFYFVFLCKSLIFFAII
jgi:hypothetical protein